MPRLRETRGNRDTSAASPVLRRPEGGDHCRQRNPYIEPGCQVDLPRLQQACCRKCMGPSSPALRRPNGITVAPSVTTTSTCKLAARLGTHGTAPVVGGDPSESQRPTRLGVSATAPAMSRSFAEPARRRMTNASEPFLRPQDDPLRIPVDRGGPIPNLAGGPAGPATHETLDCCRRA